MVVVVVGGGVRKEICFHTERLPPSPFQFPALSLRREASGGGDDRGDKDERRVGGQEL